MKARSHRILRTVVAVSIAAFALLGYASNQVFDGDEFAGLVSRSLEDADVRELLANKAVDVAVDASDADAALAAALPDEVALVATPAIELVKPTVADAGASLLGNDTVQLSIEKAVRSAHRQTVNAVLAEEDVPVVINTRPLLTVVAEEIGGDAGARAVVGLNLPESATQIDLGQNSSGIWALLRLVPVLAGVAFVVLIAAVIAYFWTAERGERLDAMRRLGPSILWAGVVLLVLGAVAVFVAAIVIEIALSPGEALTFSSIRIGGVSSAGGVALAEALLGPLLALGRRTIINGLLVIGLAHLFGDTEVATAIRRSFRERDIEPTRSAMLADLPSRIGRTRRAVWSALGLAIIGWPSATLRFVLTATVVAAVVLFGLALIASERGLFERLRELAAVGYRPATDQTERTERATTLRTRAGVVAAAAAFVWPSFSADALAWLIVPVAIVMAGLHHWELRKTEQAIEVVHVADDAEQARSWRWAGGLGLGVVAIGVLAATAGATTAPSAALEAGAPEVCNGHADLCDRHLDDVAIAGTHNSMSAASLGWELANHESAIPAQLDGGIRALLIDVQRWSGAENLDEFANDPEALEIAQQALAGADAPEDGLWMCHKLCQLGGTPFRDFVADLRAFLDTNPDEVVIVVIQDEAPAADIVAALAAGGLDEFALRHELGTPWPTLGEMIQDDTRVLFLAENEVPPDVGWYQLAFEGNVSETDFSYAVIEDFECAANRGGDDGELFMINHWVETGLPVPDEADAVNSESVLLDRVAGCESERSRGPGIIAVNFWERGDLFGVVDQLNGLTGE